MKLKVDYILRSTLMLLLFVALTGTVTAQRTITGTVTDAGDGEPLIGASVLVVGTSTGTITDFDGTYSLSVPEGAAELEYSYTGYTTQRVAIGASNTIDLALGAGTVLDEVVVVGYGTTTRQEVTSSVTSVKAEDFNQGGVNDPVQLVQGKVAGLAISTVGGDPNGDATLRLRGLSTVGANAAPLVVIDGVIGGTLESVDPNDIESIDVLKDGSAAAIYGTRGSSGVILITTKKGVRGKTTVEYNAQLTSESIAKSPAIASAAEFRRLRPDTDLGANTDWVDLVTDNSLSHTHGLAFSGGVGGSSYRASLNYRDINGIGMNSGFDQLNGRLNLSQKTLNDKLTVGLNVSATQRETQDGFNEAFRYAMAYNPTAPAYADANDPNFEKYGGIFQAENFDYFNPVGINEQSIGDGTERDILVSIRGDYEVVDGLTLSTAYSINNESDLEGRFYQNNAYFRGFNNQGFASRFTEDRNTDLFEVTANYNTDFGDNGLDILVGYSWQEVQKENFYAQSSRFISNDIGYNNLGFGNRQNVGDPGATNSFQEKYNLIGFFGRANLNIDDTYFLMASARRDGASQFGENNKWGFFPAVSAGVNLANLIEVGSVDNLKLRVGYGQTGSLPPNPYLAQFLYVPQGSFFFNGDFVPAFGPFRNANPDLKWETKSEINAGIDFAFLDYKLTGSVDVYNRTTNDLIYEVSVPVPPNLAPRTWANLEDVELVSSGVELVLGYNHSNDDGSFTWNPNLTFGTYKTSLNTIDAPDAQFKFFQGEDAFFQDTRTSPGAPGLNDFPQSAVVGNEEIGTLWGAEFAGLDENGLYTYADTDGNGTVEVGFGAADNGIIGNGMPDFSLGFQNSFTFGDLDFSFFLRGDFGHDLMNMYRVFYEYPRSNSRPIDNIVQTEYFDENVSADQTPFPSSLHVEDGSFLAIDNATLGYSFPIADDTYFSRIRVYVTARNFAYFTNYSGVDPAVRFADAGNSDNGGTVSRADNPDPLAPGLDRRNNYFRTQQFTLGINLGF